MLECHPIQKFHGDERFSILLTDVIDRANVGMIQRRCCFCLAPEATENLGIIGYILGQELKSHKAVQACVLSLVDNTHAATAEFLNHAVVRNGLADHPQIPLCLAKNARPGLGASQRAFPEPASRLHQSWVIDSNLLPGVRLPQGVPPMNSNPPRNRQPQ